MKGRVLVGMSGGVDSTVASILLRRDGWEPVGLYMKLHDNEEFHRENFAKARRVGEYLDMEVLFRDCSGRFSQDVYDYFVESYRRGETPNPCMLCNRYLKFGEMVSIADSLGIEKIATGHYLRSDGRFLYRAVDIQKDQSYFLASVRREVVPRLLFPLGELLKEEVREIASSVEPLRDISSQKESSEICFVENDYTEVLSRHMDIDMEGEVVDPSGRVVGKHRGYMHYTIGKRRGFTVHGAHEPHYVLSLIPQENRIVVGKRHELSEKSFVVRNLNMFEMPGEEFECSVKVRYRTEAVEASVVMDGEGARVTTDKELFGLAKGQFAVFYDGDRVLGGGIIV